MTEEALSAFDEVIRRFPDTRYARDAAAEGRSWCRDHLAGKEMEIGRYYQRRGSTWRRSTASSSWSSNTRPPAMCPRRCTA